MKVAVLRKDWKSRCTCEGLMALLAGTSVPLRGVRREKLTRVLRLQSITAIYATDR